MNISSLFSSCALLEAVNTHKKVYVQNIQGSAKALLLHALLQDRSILLVTTKQQEENFYADLLFLQNNPLVFPCWDTLIGENISPNIDIIGKRMQIFYQLLTTKSSQVLLTQLPSLLQKIPCLKKQDFAVWNKKTTFSWEAIPLFLEELGYKQVAMVTDKNQFAMRHGIVDLFPICATTPYRIEFFGDTIDTIRTFDPVHQKSIEKKETVLIAPTNEKKCLSTKQTQHLWDIFPEKPLLVLDDLAALEDLYVKIKNMPGFSSSFVLSMQEFFSQVSDLDMLYMMPQTLNSLSSVTKEGDFAVFSMFQETLKASLYAHAFYPVSLEMLEEPEGLSFSFLYEKASYKKQILELIKDKNINPCFVEGYLSSGFAYKTHVFFAQKDITNKKKIQKQQWRSVCHANVSHFHNLKPMDLVVHFHSGIGRYLGIEKQKNHLNKEVEFLVIEYAKKSKLYVPIAQAHLISKYIGTSEKTAVLSDLGSKKWHQAKIKAQKEIIGYASDLLHLYAQRQQDKAIVHQQDSTLMQEFAEDFPYEETPDQKLAIKAVQEDLQKPKPMDRLIIGDVGYGKTEVAMRAAFKAVVDGPNKSSGQVAVLVPTTVLAQQHYENFVDRMQNYSVKVGILSRLHKPKEIAKTLEEIASGKIDIVIGTHRLLSKDIAFFNLALLIIDEEQRFGVRAKESLKARKEFVHALSLSATPIPRTLYMSLVGARDISVIATPPQERLPIKTILAEIDDAMIKNAILRELAREGQAFYLHNRVESIAKRAEQLQKLVPSARIQVVHGQMPAKAIDDIIHEFRLGAFDVLVSTIIIEHGLDIPKANTIIIENAQCFGISDLHQLRGRVGRSNLSAYAYFLLPKNRSLQETAQKRLQVLVETSGYGTVMQLSMRDLELRGPGDILGTQQSGQVASIGFHLYCKLLQKALRSLKEKKPISFSETKMEFIFPAFLPEYYIPAKELRMEFYHRLGEAESKKQISNISQELQDRFGALPKEVSFLVHMANIRLFATDHKFTKMRFMNNRSFTAERTLGNKVFTKTLPIPPSIDSPKKLEQYVCAVLEKEFLQKKVRNFSTKTS